jgi:hypothetical protein
MQQDEWEALIRVAGDLTREFNNVRMQFDDNPGSEGESYSESNQPGAIAFQESSSQP